MNNIDKDHEMNLYEETDKVIDIDALDQTTDGMEAYSYFYERLFLYITFKHTAVIYDDLARKQLDILFSKRI